uniref:26S proteasome non-ATPase regulatory subunit 12 n=1 Tax=Lygus hesperus TaxID=30085 RepID=A0A0A9W254_LYGHE
MTTYDRAKYLLEQLRLCLKNNNYVRAELVSKKILSKQFSNPSWSDIRLTFYTLMLQLYAHENNYLEQAKLWKSIFDIYAAKSYKELIELNAQENDNKKNTSAMIDDNHDSLANKNLLELDDTVFPNSETVQLMQNALLETILFSILTVYNEEIQQIVNDLSQQKKILADLPLAKNLLNVLMTKDLVLWPLVDHDNHPIEDLVKQNPIFNSSLPDENNTQHDRWKDLHTRIVEKNIRTIASHYSQITLTRLSELLGISVEEAEDCLCTMTTGKQLRAKIDRPEGIVQFKFDRTPVEVLTEWTSGISKLFDLVENTANLIHKENMTHNIKSRVV